jgi:hypothetical protein
MSPEHDDPLLARLWRGVSDETPAPLLDARILQAARLQHQRRRVLPLAAALAACLVLGIAAVQLQSATENLPVTSTVGLYDEGITAVPVNSEAVQQRFIRQLPGGTESSEVLHP